MAESNNESDKEIVPEKILATLAPNSREGQWRIAMSTCPYRSANLQRLLLPMRPKQAIQAKDTSKDLRVAIGLCA